MTREPVRWKDAEDADVLTRDLLRAGRKTAALPSAKRMRGERRLARVAAAPIVALGVGLWSKVVAAAFGAGFASALVVVSVSPALREKLWQGSASSTSAAAFQSPPSSAPPLQVDERAPGATAEPLPGESKSPPAARPSDSTNHIARSRGSSQRSSVAEPAVLPPAPAPAPFTEPAPALSGLAVMPPAAPAPTVAADDRLSAEVLLLSQARALVNDDPDGALALLNRHARQFPGGALAMEREVLVIEALARSGRTSDARARARELLAASPGAIYAARLQRIVGKGTR